MDWFKEIISIILSVFTESQKQKTIGSSAAGEDASALEIASMQKLEQEVQQHEKKEAKDDYKYVVDGAKIQCSLCSNPQGILKVLYDTPTIGDKPAATVMEKDMKSLLFQGTCSKSLNSSGACASLMKLDKWKHTGSTKIQDQEPLLLKSTATCLYGGTDIKITDSGQRNRFAYDLPHDMEEDTEDTVNISISVFFDGTQNNKFNTEARLEYEKKLKAPKQTFLYPTGYSIDRSKQKNPFYDEEKATYYELYGNKNDDSYENDFSNVARLFKYFDGDKKDMQNLQGRVYVEGIATGDELTDDYRADSTGQDRVFGTGGTGVRGKMKKGCVGVTEKIIELNADKKHITRLSISVFGFSRGAAAARNFIHEISKAAAPAHTNTSPGSRGPVYTKNPARPAHGHLGELFQEHGIKVNTLSVHYAGLYDTVSSYGLYKDDDVEELGLDAVRKARYILHLTAANEHRKYFPLININSAAGSGGRAKEKFLPGVHSDIGGGYRDQQDERIDEIRNGNADDLELERTKLISEGWFKDNELRVHINYTKGKNKLSSERKKLSNQYSHIPLHIMGDHAAGSPIYIHFNTVQLKTKLSIPASLVHVYNRLNEYVLKDGPALRFISRKELNKEILAIRATEHSSVIRNEIPYRWNNYGQSTYVAPKQKPIQLPLDPEHYNDHPELKQKITDHNTLLWLRNTYLHWSSDNDWFGMEPSINGANGNRKRTIYNG